MDLASVKLSDAQARDSTNFACAKEHNHDKKRDHL